MNEEVTSQNDGEKALEAVKEKEKALRALISIGKELQGQSGALGLVNSVVSGEKIPITQKAFIAAQEMTKTLSLEELAKFYKGLELKSSKCLKIICLRTDILDESEIKGTIPKQTEGISLLKITKAFRKGAASTQAIEKLISKRNPHAKVAKSKELEIPVEKVQSKLKDLKIEEEKIRDKAVDKASTIQDDLEKIMNDPTVSDKVREAAMAMQAQVQEVEEQLKSKNTDFSTAQIYVEEVTLGGDDFDETGASETEEEEVIVEDKPKPKKKTPPPPPPTPKPEPIEEPEVEEEEEPQKRGIFSRFINWLMSDFNMPAWWPGSKKDKE